MKRNDVKLEEFYRWNFNENFKLIKKNSQKRIYIEYVRFLDVLGCCRLELKKLFYQLKR